MTKFYSVLLFVVLALAQSQFDATGYRSIDGTGNNVQNPARGSAVRVLRRNLEGWFGRSINTPNPRNISNLVAAYPGPPPKSTTTNLLETFFGQFINHDKEDTRASNTDFYSIPLPPGDVLTRPSSLNAIVVGKGVVEVDEDDDEQILDAINFATSWLDLSTVYGSDSITAADLRDPNGGGKLKVGSYTVGPFTFANELPSAAQCPNVFRDPTFTGAPASSVVVAGDFRVGENIALTLMHTLYHREHNRWATELAAANPTWDDEKLYQEARKLNIAQYQRTVFEEYLPKIVSGLSIPSYNGYKKNRNPDTSIEFATGAFRYGHSTTSPYKLLSDNHCPFTFTVPAGVFGPFPFTSDELPFAGQLGGAFTPSFAYSLAGGPERIVRGIVETPVDLADIYVNNVLRNVIAVGLIGNGVDLVVSDIVRGRETGLPSYYDLRRAYYEGSSKNGLYNLPGCSPTNDDDDDDDDDDYEGNLPDPIECFLAINDDPSIANALRNLYGKVTEIDGFIGLMAEKKENPSEYLPRTAANIILNEYVRSRESDRFWYERYLTTQQISGLRSFATILQDNFPNLQIQSNPFDLPATPFTCTP